MKKDKKNNEITKLQEKVAELTAGWQRTQADFENHKKKSLEERSKLIKSANSDLIYELLPILDNFQLAAKHLPRELENNNWAQGVQQIEKQFEEILNQSGLTKIETIESEFNPELHEAVGEVKSDKKEGTIIEEVLAGYKYDNIVLRPAKVKVAR